jgi:hypothetical protein
VGTKPITITKIELVDAQGFTLTKAQLGPILSRAKQLRPRSRTCLGLPFCVRAGSPIAGHPGDRCHQAAPNLLLLYLSAPQSEGRMSSPKVTYTEDGKSKAWRGGQILTVVPGSKCGKATF